MNMIKDWQNLKKRAEQEFKHIKNSEELEELRVKYLGRNGELAQLMTKLKDATAAEKPKLGKAANEVKEALQTTWQEWHDRLAKHTYGAGEVRDATLPGTFFSGGSLHPNTILQYELEDIFRSLGFRVMEGPDIESEFFNFTALNIPADHPAREMQDTFWLNDGNVLKTHTSAMQVRAMQQHGAPLRAIFPGKCFRYEATDASHDSTFYQLEGLMIDKNITIANLIAVMKELLRSVFHKDVKVRQRPGYFPFVEPGFELDINCLICGGKGCSVCKQSGWLELLPCGLVHPEVLKAGGLDPDEWTGFAFGLGLTRLVMMRYGIDDIRLLESGDLRFLRQF
ncbi:MAG: phenylalanine--tRNA ligase subunit alpha [Candidatus Komeilibacteria bacterium]